jgi:hypothetical protein
MYAFDIREEQFTEIERFIIDIPYGMWYNHPVEGIYPLKQDHFLIRQRLKHGIKDQEHTIQSLF